MRLLHWEFLALAVAFTAHVIHGQSSAQAILDANCTGCHGAAQMSGLDMRDRDGMLRGGKRGPAIVPGKATESLLYRAILRKGDLQMPPGKNGLVDDQVAVLKAWIDNGASWSGESAKTGGSGWWAFRKPLAPAVPAVRNTAWVKNPVDAFILSKLEAEKLHPAAPAAKAALARRAYFDLHGLPPTPAEVERFLKDDSPRAYEDLIDQLLASPRYGERWGRHWLDVVRYADTGGYETDVYFANAWRYRDYVIQSFNEDKPYNQFVKEQIAADELWPDNLELDGSYDIPKQKLLNLSRRIGTGMYTVGAVAQEYALFGDQFRAEWQAEAVETTGAAFLGLTMGCARCHDHKFDPITQRDYYRFAALFSGSEEREIPVVSQVMVYEYTRFMTRLSIVDQLKGKLERLDAEVRKRSGGSARKRAGRYAVDGAYTPSEKDERESLLRQIGDAYVKAPVPYGRASVLGHAEQVPDSHILLRGDFKQKGEKVGPGFPAAIFDRGRVDEPSSGLFVPQRRKALAEWMAADDHPLLARVMVNRIWQGHFGRGIVATSNDFGRQGDAPTHPELLDWLATEFVRGGWSVKAMQRTLMLSNTYRMSSGPDAANSKIDADNRYFWRMNRRRLEAEALRDAVLAVSGELNPKPGGPPVAVPLSEEEREGMRDATQWPVASDPAEHSRRSVYLLVKRSFRLPMFETFDQPDAAASCARRESSTIAPQALALMNSGFMTGQAAKFAARLRKEYGEDPETWVDRGWKLVLGRGHSVEEKSRAVAFAKSNGLERLCLLWFNMSEFVYVD
ncbi:MAG: DUF1553 domain-containing protein [Bryobacterales bacterium]|nr:DUF1553 domain-containing protein [Bryobacterales bacterium]